MINDDDLFAESFNILHVVTRQIVEFSIFFRCTAAKIANFFLAHSHPGRWLARPETISTFSTGSGSNEFHFHALLET